MNDLEEIEKRYPDNDPIDNDVRALIAELRQTRLQKDEAIQKGKDLCCGFGNLLLAAMDMVKHQKDRHELSSCCHDVTPSPAYKLETALKELNNLLEVKPTEKRKCGLSKPLGNGETCVKDLGHSEPCNHQ